MKTYAFGNLRYSIFILASAILFLSKNVNAVDASNFSKIIYKAGSWQVVEIHAKTKVLYRIATDSLNVKDTHLTIDFLEKCKPEPVVMIKKFKTYSPSLNGGMLMLEYKIPDLFQDIEIVETEMSKDDTYAFFKFKNLTADWFNIANESSRLSIWVSESGDGKIKGSSSFYFSLEGFKSVFLKANKMCKANT